jgi:hypothetical protein
LSPMDAIDLSDTVSPPLLNYASERASVDFF